MWLWGVNFWAHSSELPTPGHSTPTVLTRRHWSGHQALGASSWTTSNSGLSSIHWPEDLAQSSHPNAEEEKVVLLRDSSTQIDQTIGSDMHECNMHHHAVFATAQTGNRTCILSACNFLDIKVHNLTCGLISYGIFSLRYASSYSTGPVKGDNQYRVHHHVFVEQNTFINSRLSQLFISSRLSHLSNPPPPPLSLSFSLSLFHPSFLSLIFLPNHPKCVRIYWILIFQACTTEWIPTRGSIHII